MRAKSNMIGRLMVSVAVAASTFAGLTGLAPSPRSSVAPVASLAYEARAMGSRAVVPAMLEAIVYARDTYPVIYHEYAISRIVPMSYEARENVSFGPWVAPRDIGATDANDDGLITEWAELYYVTHDWSEYGQQIRQMIPGDALAINGKGVLVVDIFDYPRDAYLEEIREIVGQDAVVLQTCEPGTPNNRIVWCTQT